MTYPHFLPTFFVNQVACLSVNPFLTFFHIANIVLNTSTWALDNLSRESLKNGLQLSFDLGRFRGNIYNRS